MIRPRALITALGEVSTLALQSLLEEFGELKPLALKLESIGRSPVDRIQLEAIDDHFSVEQVSLGREVGVLEVYEETEDEIIRYRVPDLYRLALKMSRKGQA